MTRLIAYILVISMLQVIHGKVVFNGHEITFGDINKLGIKDELNYKTDFADIPAETVSFISYDDCLNMSTTLEQAYNLGTDIFEFTLTSGMQLGVDISNILNCSGIGFITCIVDNFKAIRSDMLVIRPKVVSLERRAVKIARDLEQELNQCLLVEPKSFAFVKTLLRKFISINEDFERIQ